MQARSFRIRGFHPLRPAFPGPFRYERAFSLHGASPAAALQPRRPEGRRFGLLPVRSPLLGESRLISSPAGTQMVHFPAYGPRPLSIDDRVHGIMPCGLPHSDIRASSGIGPYTRLFAAYHVLLRLTAPRHPPWTLIHLTMSLFQSLRLVMSKTVEHPRESNPLLYQSYRGVVWWEKYRDWNSFSHEGLYIAGLAPAGRRPSVGEPCERARLPFLSERR